MVRRGKAVLVWHGAAWKGKVRPVRAVMDWLDMAGYGSAR